MTVPVINQGSMPLATPGGDQFSNVIGSNLATGFQTQASGLTLLRMNNAGRPLKVIPLGDSITQGSATDTGGLWQWGTSYAEASILQVGPRYRIMRNAGIAGNTTAQMLARLSADVIAYTPDVCLFMGGTNDILSGMADSAYTSMFNNIEQIALRLLRAGILPVIVTPPPKNGAPTETTKAQWFYYALAQYYGLPLIDMFRTLVDPTNGNFAAGYSSDGTHPNDAGITVMMAQAQPVLANLSAAYCAPYLAAVSETNTNQFSNLLANGAFANSTTPPTPNGWTINQTNATATLVTPSLPYTGKTYTYNKTSSGAAYALQGSNISTAGFSVGDSLFMSVRMKVSGLTPASASGYSLALDATTPHLRMTSWKQNGDFTMAHQFVVPSGVTFLQPTLFVQDVGQYEVSNWTVLNVTRANAIWQPGLQ